MRTFKIATIICGACFASLAVAMILILSDYERAAHPSPSPSPASPAINATDIDGFPSVDWKYWKEINPDIIGWITIPGTNVDYPIAQAPKDDPLFYLNHDVYRNWNYMGCPYLDSSCSDAGLEESSNAVIFGHNLGYGDESMFAHVSNYLSQDFARTHRVILVQTPSSKSVYHAQGCSCINGEEDSKRTDFENQDDLSAWYKERIDSCSVQLGSATINSKRILTLCTCSYNYWSNERTLVFATPFHEKG